MSSTEGEQPAEELTTPQDPEARDRVKEPADMEAKEATAADRPQRTRKPSPKVIQNRLIESEENLEELWKTCKDQIPRSREKLSVHELRTGIEEARSIFNDYQLELLATKEFAAGATSAEVLQDLARLEETMASRKAYLDSMTNDVNERIKSLLLETRSMRSAASGSVNSVTSTRVKAKAKAAGAIKKAELQKRRLEIELRAAYQIEDMELELVRRKRDQQAKLEAMRIEEEAEVAIATAKAIDEELDQMGLDLPPESFHVLDLPPANPKERVEEYLNSQRNSSHLQIGVKPENEGAMHSVQTPEAKVKPEPQTEIDGSHAMTYPNPSAHAFIPANQPPSVITPYIEFMARRELISNKIEKFDDKPENYHTWKGSFLNMIQGVNLSQSEQLALIIEYTTNDSKRLAQRLRNAYVGNPGNGLREVWKKLGERFGSNAVVTQVHLDKLKSFPRLATRDNKRLQEFGDLLLELQCAKNDGGLTGLKILDEPTYLRPLVLKLPDDLQGRWQRQAYKYKTRRAVDYPPFSEFSEFVQETSRERNDPYLTAENPEKPVHDDPYRARRSPKAISVAKTELGLPKGGKPGREVSSTNNAPSTWCFIHEKPHPLRECRALKAKPYDECIDLLSQNHVCYRCVASCDHFARDCTVTVKCAECRRDDHVTALHPGNARKTTAQKHGEERKPNIGSPLPDAISSSCTQVCGKGVSPAGKSCSKICLANLYVDGSPDNKVKAYILIDDQSNYSLATTKLFEKLNIKGTAITYTLKTCSGVKETIGRRARGLIIESLDQSANHRLPVLTECNDIPNNREEIPTPQVARAHPHLRAIAEKIPELDEHAEILVLVGRDIPALHKVHESRNGLRDAPWGQRLDLGWVVLGNTCLDGGHKPGGRVTSCKTQVLHNGRPSLLEPCPNRFSIKHGGPPDSPKEPQVPSFDDGLAHGVFTLTKHDNKPGLSVEDRRFLQLMDCGMSKDATGNWQAPLPFRQDVRKLPNSRDNALKRLRSTRRTLDRKPAMKGHYFAFMQNVFENGHAEPVPVDSLEPAKPCWYLPHFGVYHPKKPDKIRVVFDSAAESNGVSLNTLLLSGPDLTNGLLGVLLRFRQEPVAVVADIEQMFHSFKVTEEHRDFLRFLWYKDNQPHADITEYRMKVHIFGNTSSPAVATYGLRKTAEVGEADYGSDAKEFVNRNFYVDDGLKSVAEPSSAIDLLRRTQEMLATANLRLHKIASSHPEVMEAFPSEDRAKDLHNLDFSKGPIPVQRSLGVHWDLESDGFTFRVSLEEKPFSRRGVLSVTNSLYDPLGLAAPVIIRGKELLRSMTSDLKASKSNEWDTPLPQELKPAWEEWCRSLTALENLKVPRSYSRSSIEGAARIELHTFCDASERAIGAVSYLKVIQSTDEVQVSFVLGKAKLTPNHATTIPRLELCAAVMGVEMTDLIIDELDRKPDAVTYYSDSRVVLGYIVNESRRFYVYVSNRVERIRRSSAPHQWRYVHTSLNPADLATRSVEANDLGDSIWHTGPTLLHSNGPNTETQDGKTAAEPLQQDPEVRQNVQVLTTQLAVTENLESDRFSRFSEWSTLQGAIAKLITLAQTRSEQRNEAGTANAYEKAKAIIIKSVQHDAFQKEIVCLRQSEKLPKSSSLTKLSPFIDKQGLLRVGGRLEKADLSNYERHPLILQSSHHVTTLIVRHYHAKVQHQGRVFTHGLIRSSGLWIIGEKRLVNSIIDKCVTCKRLRGRHQLQKMADLPAERLTPAPPFSYVGLDVFGPWQVCARRTRGGFANAKRWAVIFTCMTTRAIHIEVIESMDTSSFINALRRFLALRGPVIQLRSDCGSNFIGARNELQGVLKSSEVTDVQRYLLKEGYEWVFNPPHASHAGGVWERMIGVTRRILEVVLTDVPPKHLTHEVLTTLMAEVTAIVNARPLVAVSGDPEAPEILTPATLLTQKPHQLKAPPGDFSIEDLCAKQWKRVQYLANVFWSRWRKEYLPTLQPRRKWQTTVPNLHEDDLVLLSSKDTPRNEWPLARVTRAYPSHDGKVRQVDLVTAKNGAKKHYRRPVQEVILLLTADLSPHSQNSFAKNIC